MNFNTPPLTQIAPFDARFASQARKYYSTKKLRKHVCQLILVCTTQKRGSQSVPPNLVLSTSLGHIRIHKARSFARPAVPLFQQNPTCLGPSINVSNKQICTLLRQSRSESDSVFRLLPVCLVVSAIVYSLSRFWCCILIP